ncbi:unnamed protein product, partial [Prorocentrum cordatum]
PRAPSMKGSATEGEGRPRSPPGSRRRSRLARRGVGWRGEPLSRAAAPGRPPRRGAGGGATTGRRGVGAAASRGCRGRANEASHAAGVGRGVQVRGPGHQRLHLEGGVYGYWWPRRSLRRHRHQAQGCGRRISLTDWCKAYDRMDKDKKLKLSRPGVHSCSAFLSSIFRMRAIVRERIRTPMRFAERAGLLNSVCLP